MIILFIILIINISCTNTVMNMSTYEKSLLNQGLVDIQSMDPSIEIKLLYATSDNFLGYTIYKDITRGFLYPAAAKKLVKAQVYLKSICPGYSIIVYDAVRPRSVQYKMWKKVKGTPQQQYVANPEYGSIHNYGAAIDISILNEKGNPLDMGTPVDFLGPLGQPRYERKFLALGKLTVQQVNNRKLLRKIMSHAGFYGVRNEWWHFNAFPKRIARKMFQVIE